MTVVTKGYYVWQLRHNIYPSGPTFT